MNRNLFPLLLLPLFFACRKEQHLVEVDYLVVGHSNFAWGPLCETYKITPAGIFADSASCAFNFNTPALANAEFQIGKYLLGHIPEQLLNEQRKNFDCESCNDAGGYSITFQKDGQLHQFSVSDLATDLPEYLQDFVGEIQGALNDL